MVKELHPRNINQFATKIDSDGRVCTKCNEYKRWDQYGVCNKSFTKRTASCKKCIAEGKLKNTRNYTREKFMRKKHNKKIKSEDPFLYKARNIRNRLMARVKTKEEKAVVPLSIDIKEWLLGQPLKCYYSGVEVTLEDMHIDHKIPLVRGGTNALNNLCIASAHMNTAKGQFTEEEFFQLLALIATWEDKGVRMLTRLKQGFF